MKIGTASSIPTKIITGCLKNSAIILNVVCSCKIPEVNHLKYEKMAEAAGLTYVYSNFEEGTLVLAKLTGYTSWPAVICSDPVENEFYETNDFGNPTKYHVEFLGMSFCSIYFFLASIFRLTPYTGMG